MTDVATVAQVASAPNGLSPMQNEVLRRTDAIFDAIGSTVSKASEQIPDVAYQYVAYGRAMNTAAVLLGIAFMVAGVWLARKYGFMNAQKAKSYYDGEWGGSRIMAVLAGFVSTFIGFLFMIINAKDFVLVWFAPKIWLLLEIVDLVKRVKG